MHRGIKYDPHHHAEGLGIWVEYGRLKDGRKGEYRHHSGGIILRPGMSRRQERCTLAHEVQHAISGDIRSIFGLVNRRQETRADVRAALMLIDIDEYRVAEQLHAAHCGGIADELDVTLHMLRVWREASRALVFA